jgi:hypothetical protein
MPAGSSYATTIRSVEFRLRSSDGLRVACTRWDGGSPARGVVQIAHGMGEHIGMKSGLTCLPGFWMSAVLEGKEVRPEP